MNSLGLKLQPYITKHHSATGMPFPDWFKALRDLEMNRYTVTLHPHQVLYVAKDGTSFEDTYEAYNSGPVAVNKWDKNAFYEVLKKAQTGAITYHDFLRESAACGVHHYVMDFKKLEARYYSHDEQNVIVEVVPNFE